MKYVIYSRFPVERLPDEPVTEFDTYDEAEQTLHSTGFRHYIAMWSTFDDWIITPEGLTTYFDGEEVEHFYIEKETDND